MGHPYRKGSPKQTRRDKRNVLKMHRILLFGIDDAHTQLVLVSFIREKAQLISSSF